MDKLTKKDKAGLKYGFRSGLEIKLAEQLKKAKVPFLYEDMRIRYTTPPEDHVYTPDFLVGSNLIIESKGRFVAADRKKHLLIKQQLPGLDIRFVFSNSKAKLYKGAKTTYGQWAAKHGFKYADKWIPEAWLEEVKEDTNATLMV